MREQTEVAFQLWMMLWTAVKGEKYHENWEESCYSLWSALGGLIRACPARTQEKDVQARHQLVGPQHRTAGDGRKRSAFLAMHGPTSHLAELSGHPTSSKDNSRVASRVISDLIHQQNSGKHLCVWHSFRKKPDRQENVTVSKYLSLLGWLKKRTSNMLLFYSQHFQNPLDFASKKKMPHSKRIT